MSTEKQYLNKEQIHNLLGEPHAHGVTLVSTDNYNEELIAEKIKSFGPEARDILFNATLNNAIIGYGQKNFGVVKIEDKYLEIHDIYQKYKVLINNPPGSTLAEDDLTPNRLMRFFRYDIRDWITQNNQGSYLWRKYSKRDVDMMPICFRGAEYLDDLTQQQADYLIETVVNMDRALGTNMVDRVIRSFDARNQCYTLLPGRGTNLLEQKQRISTHPGVLHDHPVGQRPTTHSQEQPGQKVQPQEQSQEQRGQKAQSQEQRGQKAQPQEQRGQKEQSQEQRGQKEQPQEQRGQKVQPQEQSQEQRGQKEQPQEQRGQKEQSQEQQSGKTPAGKTGQQGSQPTQKIPPQAQQPKLPNQVE